MSDLVFLDADGLSQLFDQSIFLSILLSESFDLGLELLDLQIIDFLHVF